jgi:tetratricopeptide (TPR) repeat protein
VGAIALLAAGATVGATVLTRTDASGASTTAATPKGPPELDLDLGVRTDPEAVALRRALTLYDHGRRKAAERIFARYGSLQAKIGAAVAEWPNGFDRLAAIADEHPKSSLAQLELGLSFFQQDRVAQAEAAWRKARRLEPDTSFAVRAEDLLYPRYFSGHPPFSPSFTAPPELARLSPPQQLAFLAARAQKPDAHAKLLYGAALQKLGRQISAEREFAEAARLAPHDADARVAAAVGRFDKANLSASFSQLGPLVRVFPKAPVVRFHLGLMLLWTGQARAGRAELERVVADGPSPYLADAQALLNRIPAK